MANSTHDAATSLPCAIRGVVVNLIEVVRITGLLAGALSVGLTDYFDFHGLLYPSIC